MQQTVIVNIHGFNSAPGKKAEELRNHFDTVIAPFLPLDTDKVLDLLQTEIDKYPNHTIHIVGTSLGAFYTLYLSALLERTNIFYHMINTSFTPQISLSKHQGKKIENYKTKEFEYVSEDFISSLAKMHNFITTQFNPSALERMFIYTGILDEVVNTEDVVNFLASYGYPLNMIRENQDHRFADISCVVSKIQHIEK